MSEYKRLECFDNNRTGIEYNKGTQIQTVRTELYMCFLLYKNNNRELCKGGSNNG